MHRFKHRVTLPAILTLLVLAIAGLIVGFLNYQRQTTQPSNTNRSAIGVALNQNLALVDLHKLQANGISFIYLRSTQGRSYFDQDYLTYREQVLGTKLAFGSIIYFSNQSTPQQQLQYFLNKVGNNSGSLPILLYPAVNKRTKAFWQAMSQLAAMLELRGKKVMVATRRQDRHLFPRGTQFLFIGAQQPNDLQYSFWRYTTNGHVKNVSGLEKGVTMFAYNGTVAQYKQKYGQLTQ